MVLFYLLLVLSLVQSVLAEAEKNSETSGNICNNITASNDSNNEVLCQAVRCATTWLHFGISLVDCDQLATLLVRVVVKYSINSSNNE